MEAEVQGMTQLTYLDASLAAIAEEMRHDPSVFFMAQDLRANLYGRFPLEEFSEERILSLPISEAGFVGAGVGAALTGLRPVIDMAYSTFLYSAMDQVVNQAAKIRYMSGGQARVPLLLLASVVYGSAQAAHHADRPFALFANSPGLKIVVPSTPYDMKGLTTAAIREDDPVLLFKDATLFEMRGPVPVEDYVIPLGSADVKREGVDVTVVAIAGAVKVALAAAQRLETEGISVEVVDPRSLVPLDHETISASVEKTGRVVVVDPAPRTCSFASELVASLAEEWFWRLRAAPLRVTAADVPTPFSPPLERQTLPDVEQVAQAVRCVVSEKRVRSNG
ncbi:alpha-ketoacid dehydrogenase subunit beta [Candidatus Protofrankia californiensis]|uniref:alpha-ketoacid dehydrogenase subunit beta n=1 Tax=Candidatus Protofrankia californiensis TaxID=1839754 RepID=UPI001F49592B|nr:transketolase C-terminal domain-containing protein [Candidatus Protofrankia californiensis]